MGEEHLSPAVEGELEQPPKREHQVSAKQLAANRRNAQLSTGPKSLQGKRTVRRNALKHGLFATLIGAEAAAGAEQLEENERWRAEMYAYSKPEGPLEEMLVDQIAAQRYRLANLLHYEEGTIRAKALQVESQERIRMSEEFLNVTDALGDSLTYEHLTSSSRGVALLLKVMSEMEVAAAQEKPILQMPLEPHDAHVYFPPQSPVDQLMLDLLWLEGKANPQNQATIREYRTALRVAIAAEIKALEPLRSRLLKEEQARLEAEKARCRVDAAEAPTMIRYHTSINRNLLRLTNQLEHLQERRRRQMISGAAAGGE